MACGVKSAVPLRQRVCDGLHGQVVEIGFGSGFNVPYYPAAVTGVAAIEPADLGWKLAGKRLAATNVPVERAGLDGQSLPLSDDSCDTAVSTWTGMDAAEAISNTHEWFEVNSGWAPPDEDELAEWLGDGVCRCPDDCLVEPEGWCSHGLASWWLILRAIDPNR